MGAITQEVNIQMLEKLADGNFKKKNPETKASQVMLEDTANNFKATDVEGAMGELFTNASNGKTQVASAITGKGVSASGSDTFATLATKIGQIIADPTGDATAVASDILSGETAYAKGAKLTGSMANRGAIANTITTQGGQYIIPAGYHNGSGKVTASFANLLAGNVKSGINIGGVVGTYAGDHLYKSGDISDYSGSVTVNCGFKPRIIVLHSYKYQENPPINRAAFVGVYAYYYGTDWFLDANKDEPVTWAITSTGFTISYPYKISYTLHWMAVS